METLRGTKPIRDVQISYRCRHHPNARLTRFHGTHRVEKLLRTVSNTSRLHRHVLLDQIKMSTPLDFSIKKRKQNKKTNKKKNGKSRLASIAQIAPPGHSPDYNHNSGYERYGLVMTLLGSGRKGFPDLVFAWISGLVASLMLLDVLRRLNLRGCWISSVECPGEDGGWRWDRSREGETIPESRIDYPNRDRKQEFNSVLFVFRFCFFLLFLSFGGRNLGTNLM